MAAAGGDRLLREEAVEALKEDLLPLAALATPNLAEAEALCGFPVKSLDDMKAAAEAVYGLGPSHVLVKGGHLAGRAADVLFDGAGFEVFDRPRIDTPHTHGTGCVMSAALAVFLARGLGVPEAVGRAKDFITAAIQGARPLGAGHGRPTRTSTCGRSGSERVLADLDEALERLLKFPLGFLIPEIRSNLGYALPGAVSFADVAAVPGRISQVGDRLVTCGRATFGASRHVARVILSAAQRFPECRSAMNIRYGPEILDAWAGCGLTAVRFDRAEEPREVKEREGSTLEWGTERAVRDLSVAPTRSTMWGRWARSR